MACAAKRRVAATGPGMVGPTGKCVGEAWDAALAGRSATARISLFDPVGLPVQFASGVKGFDSAAFASANQVRPSSGQGALGEIQGALHACRDHGPRRVSPFLARCAIPNMPGGLAAIANTLCDPRPGVADLGGQLAGVAAAGQGIVVQVAPDPEAAELVLWPIGQVFSAASGALPQ